MFGTQAFATESKSRAAMNRRQLINCMSRQMAGNKSISYEKAAKVCNDQLKGQNGHAGVTAQAGETNPR